MKYNCHLAVQGIAPEVYVLVLFGLGLLLLLRLALATGAATRLAVGFMLPMLPMLPGAMQPCPCPPHIAFPI